MKLESIPDSGTIIALRGDIDFYFWKGIPVARRWPRKSTVPRTAKEIRSSELFSAAAKMTGMIDPLVAQSWKDAVAGGQGVTWVDAFRAMARGKSWLVVS